MERALYAPPFALFFARIAQKDPLPVVCGGSWAKAVDSERRKQATERKKNIGFSDSGEPRRASFFSSHLFNLSLKKKITSTPAFSTAKMARSSVFAFIGVCLAVVAAGSSSVSGKGTKGFEIATEEIALHARERKERPPRHALSFPFCSPQPFSSSSSILLSNSSKTAAPARSLLEKAGGEGE